MQFNIKFNFNFNSIEYSIKGLIKTRNNVVYINLGYAGDEFPCIMLEFDKKKQECKVSKLRAQKFGGWKQDDRIVCMTPPLGKTGALDILVLLSLAIIRKYIGTVKTYINDGAMVDNQYPLSWKKFWVGKGTTYSKYGFRFRFPESDSSEFFKSYMKEIRQKLQAKMPGSNITIEKYIKNMFDKRLVKFYDPVFTNEKLKDLDIRGIWYMDWEYYDNLTNKVEINFVYLNKVEFI